MSETNSSPFPGPPVDWNKLSRSTQGRLVAQYGSKDKVPTDLIAQLPFLEAKAPRWGRIASDDVRQAAGLSPVNLRKRMELDESEIELVNAHRARTATTRAFNEGVEAAASLIENHTPENGQFRMSALAYAVRALLRKV
jgi:hypothetical protein